MSEEYEVKLKGPGIQVTQTVPRGEALRLLAVLMGNTPTIKPREAVGDSNQFIANEDLGDEVTIGEFIDKLNVSSNPERLAAIALYLRDRKNQRLVPRDDFADLFQKSGEALPKNLSRDLREAVSKKLLAEDHAQSDHYFVTKSGIERIRTRAMPATSGEPRGRRELIVRSPRKPRATNQRGRRGAATTRKGPTAKILALKASGWFNSPRNVQDILKELARRGSHHKRTDLTRLMITLVGRDDLVRLKRAPKEGGREIWYYSAH